MISDVKSVTRMATDKIACIAPSIVCVMARFDFRSADREFAALRFGNLLYVAAPSAKKERVGILPGS
jgi:hypothetical protein